MMLAWPARNGSHLCNRECQARPERLQSQSTEECAQPARKVEGTVVSDARGVRDGMSQERVTAQFSKDGREVMLVGLDHDCRLHCTRMMAPVRDADGVVRPTAIRMLATKPKFPALAQGLYRENAVPLGVDADAMEVSLFLARTFRLIYRRQWALTGHDILGHGHWSIEDKPVVSEITESCEGTPWNQLLRLSIRHATSGPRIQEDAIARARQLHDELLIAYSPWLEDLQQPWSRPLDADELGFARELQDWESCNWPEVHDLDAAWRGEALDTAAMELYRKRLRQRLHNLRRRKRTDGERNRRLIARLLWAGRREFLFQFHQAAMMIVRALRHCPEFSPLERRAFELTHTAAWNGWTGIFRVDELMQGFIGMDIFDRPATLWLCLLALGQGDAEFSRELVCAMWYVYLRRQREQILLQRGRWRERDTGTSSSGDLEQAEAHSELKPADAVEFDEVDPEVVRRLDEQGRLAPALHKVRSPTRRKALRFWIARPDCDEAARLAGCSIDTVRRAVEELGRILDERTEE